MRRHIQVLFWALVLILCTALPVQAAVKSYTVLPFAIHGPQEYRYLSEGIRSMLVSRLGWEDNFESTPADSTTATAKDITSQDAASALRQKIGTDYLVWGSATIMGEQASLDASMLGPETTTTKTRQTALDDLIPAMEEIANELSNEVFGKPEAEQTEPEQAQTQQSGPTNPNFVVNESSEGDYYLNPQFEYQGSPNTPGRWRSQSLNFEAIGMITGDADSDGTTEVFILTDHTVGAYRIKDRRLAPIAEYDVGHRIQCLNINLIDTNRDGYQEIVVSAKMDEFLRSFILNFKNDQLEVKEEKIDLYLNVLRTPPTFTKTLVGQKKGNGRLFDHNNVHQVTKMNGEYQLGSKLTVPDIGNIFNFCYLPQKDGYKIVAVDFRDNLRVYNESANFQSSTDGSYAATGLGLEKNEAMLGMDQQKDRGGYTAKFFYVPARLVPSDMDEDGNAELLVNRAVSVSAQFFQRYRNFPQGSLQALAWDGIGMNLVWKTRIIKGSVIDYGLEDVDGDGGQELYACVITHPGATGLQKKRSLMLSYDLDKNGNTPQAAQDSAN
ncbi:FG-GAP-like repeat-containing protein [Desulfohalobium retbaense]|uniref:FG-GAP repeat protein n=1 Tax=Desulfohalobium retbaense (strain ATCC 49708 / DSM 5692 / JCM 16813 / HR100) TaxID=485915 RepID=C8X419_DESRD|nr:FG-GAP-like repeat-containing protein [Desulfohalobium retbaense]ACV69166.1 conserved hypothetical protein [Desulfohalobium retbaense DSM 5692]